MGRQQYLERLALGRSPFQDPAACPAGVVQSNQNEVVANAGDIGAEQANVQRYDSKGRPINKRTDARNAAMRNAQNAVLALVGVVESKDASDRVERALNQINRKQWEEILEAEQERGTHLNMILEYVRRLLTWWPEAMMARIQAGLYLPTQSFADILLRDFRAVRTVGIGACFAVFLPGLIPHALCTLADTLLCSAAMEAVGRVQAYLASLTKSRKTLKRNHAWANVASEVLCAGISAALMPLEYHAEAQRLGIIPNRPLLPHWRSLMPYGPSSSHRFLWTSPFETPVLRFLGSPGLWLVLQRSLTRYQDEEHPIAAQITTWEYLPVNNIYAWKQKPCVYHDPLAWTLYHGYLLRIRILKLLGWSLEQGDTFPENPYQNNMQIYKTSSTADGSGNVAESENCVAASGKYRSTALSMQVAQYIGERIDYTIQKILMLPLQSLAVRAVTQSLLRTALPKTALASKAAPFAFSPLSRGPISNLLSHGSNAVTWSAAGSHLSKVGLSFALLCSTEVAISFFIYAVYRNQGVRNFGWTSERTWED